MEQLIAATLGGGGLMAALFVFGRKAFVRWTQENVQINAAEAVSEVVVLLRQQLVEFKKENAELKREIAELREEIRKLREERS